MTDQAELRITLPDAVATALRDIVSSGEYGSVTDVVCLALTEWHDRRTEALRGLVRDGSDSGPSIDADIVFASLRRRLGALTGP